MRLNKLRHFFKRIGLIRAARGLANHRPLQPLYWQPFVGSTFPKALNSARILANRQLKIIASIQKFRVFCVFRIFHFPHSENQDTLYFVWKRQD
jgi:hypothetical protein